MGVKAQDEFADNRGDDHERSCCLRGRLSGQDRDARADRCDARFRQGDQRPHLLARDDLPQVEQHGQLTPVVIPEVPVLQADDTARVARDLIGANEQALRTLKEEGACDISYMLPDRARFRVNVFRQRGTFAVVMRVIAAKIPTLADLNLPPSLAEIASLKNGIVLVTGPTGSGKSSTLAAIIDLINETRAEHIITIEDPVEFLHHHKKATVHQRELHTDTPTFAAGAPRRAASGAQGDSRRRDARPRNDRDRADGGGDRPPGLVDAAYDRRVQDGRARHRHVRGGRSAERAHAPGVVFPLLHLPASDPQERRRTRRSFWRC